MARAVFHHRDCARSRQASKPGTLRHHGLVTGLAGWASIHEQAWPNVIAVLRREGWTPTVWVDQRVVPAGPREDEPDGFLEVFRAASRQGEGHRTY